MTGEEKQWGFLVSRRMEFVEDLAKHEKQLQDEPNHLYCKLIEVDIEQDRKIMAIIDGKLGL